MKQQRVNIVHCWQECFPQLDSSSHSVLLTLFSSPTARQTTVLYRRESELTNLEKQHRTADFSDLHPGQTFEHIFC
jgi:hypothetical protein